MKAREGDNPDEGKGRQSGAKGKRQLIEPGRERPMVMNALVIRGTGESSQASSEESSVSTTRGRLSAKKTRAAGRVS